MLSRIYEANQGLLRQKRGLLEALVTRFGPEQAQTLYQTTCPIVGASVGQHLRHSLDHMAAAVAATGNPDQRRIHYDRRSRQTPDETDLVAAQARIAAVGEAFDQVAARQTYLPVMEHRVEARFLLSGDADATDIGLPSTAARELAFGAHHAIHHLAMVRIIVLQTLDLPATDLPSDFGRAPSTLQYENAVAASGSGDEA
jgi:hypothetical protein